MLCALSLSNFLYIQCKMGDTANSQAQGNSGLSDGEAGIYNSLDMSSEEESQKSSKDIECGANPEACELTPTVWDRAKPEEQGNSILSDREANIGNSFELSSDDKSQKTSKDTEYGGVNITNLWREMSLQKMWHERTWTDIVKHFATTLIVSVLPTFYDCGTDVTSVMKYWREAQNLEEMGYELPYENETYSWKVREYRVYSGISLV